MTLTDVQVKELNNFLRKTAPEIDRLEERGSRRFEGDTEMGSGDARGYRGVIVYLQKGLGGNDDLLKQIFHCMQQCQLRYRLKYDLGLFSFGWDDNKLKHSGSSHYCAYNSSSSGWVDELCGLAGKSVSPAPAIIPSLFPLSDLYGNKHNIGRDDLLIFICQNKEVRTTETVLEQLNRRRSKHVIWFFVDTNTVEVVTNGYYPDLI
jgi:hypothetical protein